MSRNDIEDFTSISKENTTISYPISLPDIEEWQEGWFWSVLISNYDIADFPTISKEKTSISSRYPISYPISNPILLLLYI
jgi:hypothetical protein